ncbi:hypothetical protein HPB47_006894 [Ixodes persulcatus]|uniref:Uncharacterized protein n=1 Tax=Ixodes persulcatus TaxID=34615 RepID=A0AC60P9I5_IXOPE|nr:hypothetical protein HPB47_006894 [Ixodes persulcatus]
MVEPGLGAAVGPTPVADVRPIAAGCSNTSVGPTSGPDGGPTISPDFSRAESHLSIRRAARQLSLSRGFVWRVLRRRIYPFKAQLLHELKPEVYTRRVHFCEDELARIQTSPSHLQFLLFTDESVFRLDGRVNKQNCRS